MAMTDVHRERELKFEVRPDFEIPDVAGVVAGGEVERATISLSSTYHDSPGLDLLAHGVTLRRRTGDEDNGWQLKIPAEGARDEISVPLGGDADEIVPTALSALLAGIVRAGDLVPVATLDTERRVTRVHRDGALVVEIADDRVVASTGGRQCDEWREVEIELGDAGDEDALAAFAARLSDSGATSSPHPSKLGRAVGRGRQRPASSPAGELVADHVRAALRRLVAGDIALRSGDDTVVHRTRVSVRRVRGVLRVFADALDGNAARALDAELSWSQHLLGEVGERQLLRARFRDALAQLPDTLGGGGGGTELDETLRTEQDAAFVALGAALATNRYRRMLTSVATVAAGDPVAPGTTPAALRRLADDATATASTRLRRALRTDDAEQLHRARKAATRARYAAEAVAPSRKHPKRVPAELRRVHDVLGAHQDAVAAAATVRRLGARAANGFLYGLLYQRELDAVARLRRDAAGLRIRT